MAANRFKPLSASALSLGTPPVAVTATAAELNILHGATASVTELNQLAGAVATAAQITQLASAVGTVAFDRSVKVARAALGALDTGGGVLSWANPEAVSIIIHRLVVDVTTVATGACTVDFGTTASTATTSSNNLLTALDTHTAAVTADNITDKGASGKSRQKLAAGKWVTGSMASGAAAGTAGFAYVYYTLV